VFAATTGHVDGERGETTPDTELVLQALELMATHGSTQASTDDLLQRLVHTIVPLLMRGQPPAVQDAFQDLNCPDTYARAVKMFQPFIFPLQEVHFCPKGCCAFPVDHHLQLKDRQQECPECGAARYSGGNPASVLRYFKLIDLIRGLFAHPILSQYVKAHAQRPKNPEAQDGIWGEYHSFWVHAWEYLVHMHVYVHVYIRVLTPGIWMY
jgi:hypothetical protein